MTTKTALQLRLKVIWGVKRIANTISASEDFVRDTLAVVPGGPVRKVGGRYCANEEDLIAYFRPQEENPKEP